jgi:anaerobic magnesium-protoporphyrin IX monomethyl ester cyclase
MRVLFIYPNVGCQIGFNYGLAHISAVLKAAGHEVRLLDVCEKLDPDVEPSSVAQRVAELEPGIVGMSVVTNQFEYAKRLARAIREVCSAPIVIGGPHPTMAPEETIETGLFDFVCVGEGEYAMRELVAALEEGRDTTDIRNMWARRNGTVHGNPVRPFVELTELPPKDYELFDFQRLIDAKQGWVGLMPTRGCPFRCAYCFNHVVIDLYGREAGCRPRDYVRRQPVPDFLDEVGGLLSRYTGITTFIFDDDIFTLDKDYLREFSEEYGRRFSTPFVCNAHVRFFDDETARLLKQAGCWMVKFGLESGSPRVRREVMMRPMSDRAIQEAFGAAHRQGLQTSAFVMMGLPGETPDEMIQTVELLARVRPSRFRWSIFFPYPGTKLHDVCVERGLIDDEKMAGQTNFMDDTCLRFGESALRMIHRLRRFYPWFVNARLPGEAGRRFAPLAERALAAPGDEIEAVEAAGREVCGEFPPDREPIYVVRYNRFMAVRTDAPGL